MTGTLLLGTVCVPLVVALGVWSHGPFGRLAAAVAPWAAIPALVMSLVPIAAESAFLGWLLLGTTLGLDTSGRVFLFFTALLWTLAGVHARTYVQTDRHRYFLFHLLALAGNIGLVLAHDLASFYLFFALMTFSAYGLVVHDGTPAAYRAGRVYIAMAVLGETVLLAGFILAAASASSLELSDIRAAAATAPWGGVLVGLLLGGFGIKAGAVPLHMWLPLAHPVAPTPASAVLSGCMIKAGLLGWLRFLPLGEAALPGWGGLVILLGIGAAFFGVLIGVTQRDPKAVLAYSSVSQMGIINVGIGIGLSDQAAWQLALHAVPLYAMHHGLAKGALFLSVSVAGHRPAPAWGRIAMTTGLWLPALAIIGVPFTSGALAKLALKDAVAVTPGAWHVWLATVLPWTAVGTTALMARFLSVLPPARPGPAAGGLFVPWALSVFAAVTVVWIVPAHVGLDTGAGRAAGGDSIWAALWPFAIGVGLALAGREVARRRATLRREVAPGDLLVMLESAWIRLRHRPVEDVPVGGVGGAPDPVAALAASWYGPMTRSAAEGWLGRWESWLVRWETAAALAVLLLAVLWGAL